MKLYLKLTLAALAIAASAACLVAQDGDDNYPQPQRPPGRDGRPPVPPLMALLDANHDGVIDATEIDNAPAVLRKLDKNGDGQLTPDELRPPRPNGPNGPGNQDRAPRGPRNGQHPPFGPGGQPSFGGRQAPPTDGQ